MKNSKSWKLNTKRINRNTDEMPKKSLGKSFFKEQMEFFASAFDWR